MDVLLQGEQLVTADKHLVTGLERSCNNALLGFDGEVDLVDRAQNLIDLADRSLLNISLTPGNATGYNTTTLASAYLVLQVDRGVEVGNLRVDRLADHLALASVHDRSHLYRSVSTGSPGFEPIRG